MLALKLGDWKAVCDRCGETYYASQLTKEYSGFMVCQTCWEPRQEVEQIPKLRVARAVPWQRPLETTFTYVDAVGDGIGYWAIGSTFVIPPTREVQSLQVATDVDGSAVVRVRCVNHRFHEGDSIDILGAGDAGYNGTFSIAVVDQDHFRYTATTAPTADENPASGVTAFGIKKSNIATYSLWKSTEYLT